jgi:hypothetical protein
LPSPVEGDHSRHDEPFAVFALQEPVRSFGILADKFLVGNVDFQQRAQPDLRAGHRDAVSGQQLLHLGQQPLPLAGSILDLGRCRRRVRAARLERDVGQVAPTGRIVADFHIRLQDRRIAAANRIQEILLVQAIAAVALEFLDQLAVPVECLGSAALAFEPPALAVRDVPAARAGHLGTALRIRCGRDVGQSDDDRDLTRVEQHEMHVRRLARVVPDHSAAAPQNPLRQRDFVQEHVVPQVVQHVNAPVAHLARARVPDPVPVVLQIVAVDRFVLRGTEPQVVIDLGRNRQRRRTLADRRPHPVAVDASRQDLAERPLFVQELLDLRLHRIGTLLGADLADLAVLLRRGHRLAAFPLAVRQRLFHVHVLARLHRPDRGQAVPVVAGGDHHRVDARIVEHAPEIGPRLGRRVSLVGAANLSPVRIAQARDRDAGQFAERSHQIPGTASATDESKTNRLVGRGSAQQRSTPSQSGTGG